MEGASFLGNTGPILVPRPAGHTHPRTHAPTHPSTLTHAHIPENTQAQTHKHTRTSGQGARSGSISEPPQAPCPHTRRAPCPTSSNRPKSFAGRCVDGREGGREGEREGERERERVHCELVASLMPPVPVTAQRRIRRLLRDEKLLR
jgi:hypothetical protein